MKKISVIIPCYNVHNYIQRCFESIKQQSIGFDELEIILIDDASTDETREDLLEIEREYPDNVLVVTCDENGKLGTARNIGISYASGEYVAFVDADDVLDAMMLEKLYRTAKNYSCDIVECGFKTFSDGEELFAEKCGEDYYLNLSGECEEVNRKQLIINSLKTAVWGRLYNRDFIVQNELLFLEKILYEDVHYTGIGMLLAGSYAYVGETLYYYYQNSNGIIKTPTEDKIKQEVGVAHLLLKDIQSRGLLNQVVQHYYNEIVFYFTCKMYIDSLNMIFDAQMGDWRRLAIYFRDNLLALFPEANQNAYTMSLVNNNRSLVAAWRILNDKSLRSDVAFGNSNSDKRIVLLNTHEFINIGDHFITEGTIRFLNDFYPGYELIEISADNYAEEAKILPYFIEEEDILVIVGGGYLGSLWLENGEYNVRDIVLRYRKNKIIIFPQSVYYSDDAIGERELELSKYAYSLHDNLTICLREKKSYDYAKRNFPQNVQLQYYPDLALYYRPQMDVEIIDQVGICLRDDSEKKQNIEISNIVRTAEQLEKSIHTISMLNEKPINIYGRQPYVNMKMKELASCRLVITDRLHCMLMCAVTGTPCIAFDNLTGKVSGVYEWIKNLKYISIVNSEAELESKMMSMLNIGLCKQKFDVKIDDMFKEMAKAIGCELQTETLVEDTRIKRYFDVYVPNEDCNLRCHYCYIAQKREYERNVFHVNDIDLIRKAFSIERLEGRCLINLCAGGETLLSLDLIDVVRELTTIGHYVQIVTNGTPTKAFNKLTGLPSDNQKRIMIKFSFHYLELKRLNLFERFWNNVDSVRKSKMSFTVEITPSDELIPHIPDVKKMCEDRLKGAMPHISICRDDRKAGIDMLTQLSETEFYDVWSTFESNLLDMKVKLYKRKIKEFCQAGVKSYSVNLATGQINMCIAHPSIGNIYDLSKPLPTCAVGNGCMLPYCFNGHSYLALGVCPEVRTESLFSVRNRIESDGTQWVKEPLATVFKNKI